MASLLSSFDAPSSGSASSSAADSSPVYLASDIHNLANNNESFWDDPLAGITGIPKFIGLGIASGVNQVYNIAPTVGNWFGGNFEQNKLADTLASYDSDIAKYYEEHQEGVDVLGFVLSSLVPGTAGIKVLRAGQTALNVAAETGVIGKGLSVATGLLAPSTSKNLIAATEQMISGGTPFKLTQVNMLKGLAGGVHQSVLEGAAFEIAVAATMYNSPVLEDQDFGDMVSNMLWGAGLSGVIGGAFHAASSIGTVKKGIKAFEFEASPWTHIEPPLPGSAVSDRILLLNEQRLFMASVLPGANHEAKLLELGKSKQLSLETMLRKEVQDLAGGDNAVADLLYKHLLAQDSKTATSNFWELKEVVRLRETTAGEKLLDKVLKMKGSIDEFSEALAHSESYLVLRGAQAGKLLDDAPVFKHHADTIKPNQAVTLSPKGIQVGTRLTPIKEAGFNIAKATSIDTEIRTAWARKYFHPKEGTIIESTDIPLLDAAYSKVLTEGVPIPLVRVGDITFQPATADEFLGVIAQFKDEVAKQLVKTRKNLTHDEISKMVNVNPNYVSGAQQAGTQVDNLFADLTELAAFNAAGGTKLEHLLDVPSTLKLAYKQERVLAVDGHLLEGMESVARQQRLYSDDATRASHLVLGPDAAKLLSITMEEMLKANRMGAGATFLAFASANLGTLGSKFEWLGKVTTEIITTKKAAVNEVLTPLLYRLQNDQAATIEWSKLMQTVRGSEHRFKLSADGVSLVLANDKAAKALADAGQEIPNIPLKSQAVRDLAKAHIELNATRLGNLKTLRASQGLESTVRPGTFYAPPPDPKDYPYFAFVVDPTITGTGHSKMLYAASEAELKTQMSAVRSQFPEFRVLEKGAAEDYYKAIGKFDYEKTLNENYINTALNKKGTSAPFLIKTDPKLVSEELLQWHLRAEAGVVRETISNQYAQQFEALRHLGKQYELAATSKYGGKSLTKYAESSVQNPYTDYIKTALGINKANEYPFWMPVQKMLDTKISQLGAAVRTAATNIKSAEDLRNINNLLQEAGFKGAYYDAALNSAVNSAVPRGLLTSYVQESNGVLSLFALGLDPLNALNNVIGSNVLLNTGLREVLKGIENSSPEAAGELTKLMKLTLPGTDKAVLSHGRLLTNAVKNFSSTDEAYHAFYKTNGFTTDLRQQYMSSLDTMALREGETVASIGTKRAQLVELGKYWADKGRAVTGNKLAEEFNRFVAADVMRQITDVAVKHGVMDSKTALSYINTFVNRTQGNFLAAQRPMMFQGPVGQAIGLFQTYQFTLLQNLFRYSAEGSKKDVAMLMGLQGSIYGMNGLPAFNAINTHIIGNASGNQEHKDLYNSVYGGAGKDAGDWLMYGLASNMFLHPDLKLNMYTRGDINPRHLTVIPTNPADVPFIASQIKFFGNLFETVGKLGEGGNISNVILQGIEHNGMSRPLAGLAQTMQAATNPDAQVVSTNNQGNVVGSNDLVSLMTLGRLLGGKPLDEALAQDAFFRQKAYAAKNSARVAKLGEVVKGTYMGGGAPDEEQINTFMESYVAAGGKQDKFNQFMMKQEKNATKSQVEQTRDSLTKPYAQTLQKMMGGYDPTPVPQDAVTE